MIINGLLVLILLTVSHNVQAANSVNQDENNINNEKIVVDGQLTDKLWDKAEDFENFKIVEPASYIQSPYHTIAYITSNKQGVVIGFKNYHDKSPSQSKTSLKDQEIRGDYNEVIIDFDGNGRRAYGFKLGRNGASQDMLWTYPNNDNKDWDGAWTHATYEGEDYWSAEMLIPWSIAVMEKSGRLREVRVFIARWNQNANEKYAYPAIDDGRVNFLSQFAPLTLHQAEVSILDFFPYFRSSHDLIEEDGEYKVGADVFWKISGNQQLNFSINPDFGQVEADDLIVNFSAVETFFSEKRPFFRENHDLFDLQGPERLRLVHTPRVGGEPDQEESQASEIQSAARYTYIGESFDFGVLYAREKDQQLSQGRLFNAGRMQYTGENYKFGVLHTYTDRQSLDRSANVSVVDTQLSLAEFWEISGQLIYSNIDSAEHKQSALSGWLESTINPSDYLTHSITLINYDDEMDISDFGFVRYINRKQWEYELEYEWPEVEMINAIRDVTINFETEQRHNHQGYRIPAEYDFSLEANLKSNWRFELAGEYQSSGVDDLLTRGHHIINLPSSYEIGLEMNSDDSKAVTWGAKIQSGKSVLDGTFTEYELYSSLQLGGHTNISAELGLEKQQSWLLWKEQNFVDHYKKNELSLSLNIRSQLSDKQELRVKIETVALKAFGQEGFTALENGTLGHRDEIVEDFSLSELAMQVRYRYELGPLSEVFLVYSRGAEFEAEDRIITTADLYDEVLSSRDVESFLFKVKFHY